MKLYACKLKYNFVVDTPLLYNLIKKISTNPSKELTKKKNTLELKENWDLNFVKKEAVYFQTSVKF